MLIYCAVNLKDSLWGGGNQFLSALCDYFEAQHILVSDIEKADIILCNSYQELGRLLRLKRQFPKKKIFYRLGPVFSYHRNFVWKYIDWIMAQVANFFVDGVIFQSHWSQKEFEKLGFGGVPCQVIGNASAKEFHSVKKQSRFLHKPVRLISVSWSKNMNKGFEFFSKLDALVGEGMFEMSFIGNSPYLFRNIKNLGPQGKDRIIEEFRNHDIFIAPFSHEACSNAILEALSVRMPVLALESGANAELLKNGGIMFADFSSLLSGIQTVSQNYEHFVSSISVQTIEQIGQEYLHFFEKCKDKLVRDISSFRWWCYYIQLMFFRLI